MTAQVLGTDDAGDGHTIVTVATSRYGQARVMVAPGMLDHPDIGRLYAHVENMESTAYNTTRRSRRDERSD